MAKKEKPTDDNLIQTLKQRGLSCSKLMMMERKQQLDAKRDRKDAAMFRSLGFNKQADLQERIAKAQESSANTLKQLRRKVCLLK